MTRIKKLAIALPTSLLVLSLVTIAFALAQQPETSIRQSQPAVMLSVNDKPAELPIRDAPAPKPSKSESTDADYETLIEQAVEEPVYEDTYESLSENEQAIESTSQGYYSPTDLMTQGRIYNGDWSYTYYSEHVLPGGGLDIPGRHVDENGYVVDQWGNIAVASDDLAHGTQISVPFGSGSAIVYDCGSGYGNIDIYTSW